MNMFFHKVRQKLRHPQWLTAVRSLAFWIPILVLLPGLIGSSFFARTVAKQNNRDFQASQREQATALGAFLNARFASYEVLLLGASALFDVKNDINRTDWRQYIENVELQQRYSAVLGLGYVEKFTADELQAHIERVRNEGFNNYTVTPDTPRNEYTATTYLEPMNDINKRALGFDMFTKPVRQQAMIKARDTASPVLSGPVHLVQDAGKPTLRGVLMYYPIYSTPDIPATVAERRAYLRGWVYLVVRPSDIITAYNAANRRGIKTANLEITDVTNPGGPGALFASARLTEKATYEKTVTISDRQWRIKLHDKDSTLNRLLSPLLTMALGTLTSITAAAILYILMRRRLDRVRATYDQALQRTKDELLALASHQLRTPASGVKQYIGLLVQGFMGKLTPQQHEIAVKAYDANERQLEIINQLLYVSKADAGQLHMEPIKTNLSTLARTAVEALSAHADAKHITLHLTGAETSRYIIADPRYIAMIIENLISNAIKYSHPQSVVSIDLHSTPTISTLAVHDNGVGIAPEHLNDVFDKFNRIENPLSRSEGGSGLGLFLARQLAEAHEGSITVTSQLNQGSVFTLTLPNHTPHPKHHSRHIARLDQ